MVDHGKSGFLTVLLNGAVILTMLRFCMEKLPIFIQCWENVPVMETRSLSAVSQFSICYSGEYLLCKIKLSAKQSIIQSVQSLEMLVETQTGKSFWWSLHNGGHNLSSGTIWTKTTPCVLCTNMLDIYLLKRTRIYHFVHHPTHHETSQIVANIMFLAQLLSELAHLLMLFIVPGNPQYS